MIIHPGACQVIRNIYENSFRRMKTNKETNSEIKRSIAHYLELHSINQPLSLQFKMKQAKLVINKKSPRGINPAVVLSPLVLSMAGTSTFNAPSNATPTAPSNAIESLPAHRSVDGFLLPAWPRNSVGRATVIYSGRLGFKSRRG